MNYVPYGLNFLIKVTDNFFYDCSKESSFTIKLICVFYIITDESALLACFRDFKSFFSTI